MDIDILWVTLLIYQTWWKLRALFTRSIIVKSVHPMVTITTSMTKMIDTTNNKFKIAQWPQVTNRPNINKFWIKIKKHQILKRERTWESNSKVIIILKMELIRREKKMKGMEVQELITIEAAVLETLVRT